MYKVTVIVPVYNVEKYLSECIESITAQTYKNLEIILVDDGSTDNSPVICDDYATKDNRIKVIHKQNGGVSAARNTALDVMTGDYVTFIDSDDVINIHFVEYLLDLCVSNNSEVSYCCFRSFLNTEEINAQEIFDYKKESRSFKKDESLKHFFSEWMLSNVCNKIFKRELFDTIRFPMATRAEDLRVMFEVMFLGVGVTGIKKIPLYYYRSNPGSAMSLLKPSNIDDMKERHAVFLKLKEQKNIGNVCERFALQTKFFLLDFVLSCKNSQDPKLLKKELKKWSKILIKDMWLPTEKNFFKKFEYYVMYLSLDMWKYMRMIGWKLFKIPLYRG